VQKEISHTLQAVADWKTEDRSLTSDEKGISWALSIR
jgi:hypothetical protein